MHTSPNEFIALERSTDEKIIISADENDVSMTDESDEKQSSLPPPLPTKQMVHITNYPLNNENALTSTNEPITNMDVDVSDDNQFCSKQSSRQDIQDEKMDICNIATDNTKSMTNGETYATPKTVS